MQLRILLLAWLSCPLLASPLLLTGQVRAADSQVFYAPRTDNWRVQVDWMMKEGQVAQVGDPVVVFDGSGIQASIDQEEVSLINAREELVRQQSDGELKVLEAQSGLDRAELLVQKARLDASVPKGTHSTFDYEKYQLELEKALVAKTKAVDKLDQAKFSHQTALEKQQLKIENHERQLAYHRHKLTLMNQTAQRSGPVIYADHPWNGEKMFVGATAQPGWRIAEIPAISGLYVEAWVHEADQARLQPGQAAWLSLDAFPQRRFEAKLKDVSQQPEQRREWGNDAYFRATFEFDVPDNLTLLPGMSAQLELQGEQDV
ncbi:hypothetical protein GCM10009092_22250 [Bowmanella denitrificans]|uniref:HlyD family secretion protein n=1 Tax=Bowmanella denitrificans TaxID=366582 RepID=A0ABN0X851_9ALTE|nr:HlyD family efflux transporter periplasmic adaptor subunit [Bowmanella denitrificans]